MKHTFMGRLRASRKSICGGAFCVLVVASPLSAQDSLISTSGGDFRSINSGSVTASGIFTDNALSVVETYASSEETNAYEWLEYRSSIGNDCIGCVMSVSAQGAMIGISSIADASVSTESEQEDTSSGGLSITDGSYTSRNSGTVSANGTFNSMSMGTGGKRNSFGVNASGSSITLSTSSSN